MTYPDHSTPETWGAGLVAVNEDHFNIRLERCRKVEPLQAAARAEAARVNYDTRPERIAAINQRIAEIRDSATQ